jgi:hypothetical protein
LTNAAPRIDVSLARLTTALAGRRRRSRVGDALAGLTEALAGLTEALAGLTTALTGLTTGSPVDDERTDRRGRASLAAPCGRLVRHRLWRRRTAGR